LRCFSNPIAAFIFTIIAAAFAFIKSSPSFADEGIAELKTSSGLFVTRAAVGSECGAHTTFATTCTALFLNDKFLLADRGGERIGGHSDLLASKRLEALLEKRPVVNRVQTGGEMNGESGSIVLQRLFWSLAREYHCRSAADDLPRRGYRSKSPDGLPLETRDRCKAPAHLGKLTT
jgi:hypothetical protein